LSLGFPLVSLHSLRLPQFTVALLWQAKHTCGVAVFPFATLKIVSMAKNVCYTGFVRSPGSLKVSHPGAEDGSPFRGCKGREEWISTKEGIVL